MSLGIFLLDFIIFMARRIFMKKD